MGSIDEPEFFVEIFLQPGEFYWGESDVRIRTILGSCVAICLWNSRRQSGGMCHFLLPGNTKGEVYTDKEKKRDIARYSEDAMGLFLKEIQKNGSNPREYDAKIFGGGCLLCDENGEEDREGVGRRNIQSAKDLLGKNGFRLVAEDVGGNYHRKIFFDLWNGEVWMKKTRYAKNGD